MVNIVGNLALLRRASGCRKRAIACHFAFVHCTRSVCRHRLRRPKDPRCHRRFPSRRRTRPGRAWPARRPPRVDALLADATAKVRERVVVEGHAGRPAARPRAARHARAGLARDLCRGGAPARRLCRAHDRRAARFGEIEEHLVRIGARRISRADRRRHSDEPGRDRAAGRSRPVAGAGRRAHRRRRSRR